MQTSVWRGTEHLIQRFVSRLKQPQVANSQSLRISPCNVFSGIAASLLVCKPFLSPSWACSCVWRRSLGRRRGRLPLVVGVTQHGSYEYSSWGVSKWQPSLAKKKKKENRCFRCLNVAAGHMDPIFTLCPLLPVILASADSHTCTACLRLLRIDAPVSTLTSTEKGTPARSPDPKAKARLCFPFYAKAPRLWRSGSGCRGGHHPPGHVALGSVPSRWRPGMTLPWVLIRWSKGYPNRAVYTPLPSSFI